MHAYILFFLYAWKIPLFDLMALYVSAFSFYKIYFFKIYVIIWLMLSPNRLDH